MPRLLVATNNRHKASELRALLPDLVIETLLDHPSLAPTVEDRDTFAGNAVKKAEEASRALGVAAIADDSGLCVDALDGEPGVHSARYAPGSDLDRIHKLISALAGVPEAARTAHFTCVIAFARPGMETITVEGRVDGRILFEPRGRGGFGYDPVFLVGSGPLTMAELSAEEKNKVSHRARATAAILPEITRSFAGQR